MERTNARTLTAVSLPEPDRPRHDRRLVHLARHGPRPDRRARSARARRHIVALVKPQFEAGRGRTDHGVVRDPAIHREVLERTVLAAQAHGLGTRAVIASPILGPEGNREFLVHLAPGPGCAEIGERIAEATGT